MAKHKTSILEYLGYMKPFQDRTDAGRQLASSLKTFQDDPNTFVLALPRGGVPVAYEIAYTLHLPLLVFLVRKLGVPWHEELAMGAYAEGDMCLWHQSIIDTCHVTEEQIQTVLKKEKAELARRCQCYRQGQPLPHLKDKTIILVDDGIATGLSMKVAICSLKNQYPQQIIIATPVASQESIAELTPLVDRLICLMTPTPFYSVGQWYQHFPQLTDQEVLTYLRTS